MRHNRVIRGIVERQQPAVQLFEGGVIGGPCDGLFRQPGELFGVAYVQRPGVRGVLDVVFEAGLCRREFLHDRLESVLGLFFEVDAGQVKVAQRVVDGAAAGLGGTGGQGFPDMRIGTLQLLIL